MLARLLKHEFRATARTLLPVYAILLATSLLVRLTSRMQQLYDLGSTIPGLFGIFGAFLMIIYTALLTTVFIITAVLLIQRFYKNLLRDEGYLMHTLPVSTRQLITAKLLPAIFWCIIAGVVAVFSMALSVDPFAAPSPAALLEQFLNQGTSNRLLMLEGAALLIFTLARHIMQVYLALTIGHLAHTCRIIWSVVAYITITFISGALTTLPLITAKAAGLAEYIITQILNMPNYSMIMIHAAMIFSLVIAILFAAVFFALTNWLMKRKLNLE